MKVLRASQYITVPWRNGGGTTREIAVHHDAIRHPDFLWRLSIAAVNSRGPFSRFDGVDRTVALLSGRGMALSSSDGSALVTPDGSPHTFKGEFSIFCELIDGPTVDLNAMTRRKFYDHRMRRERFVGETTVVGKADKTYLVSNSDMEISWRDGREIIKPLDTIAEISSGTKIDLYSDDPAEIFAIELTPR